MDKKTTTIKDRILYLAEFEGVSKEKFIENLNQKYANYKGVSKNSSPSSDVIARISTKYPNVNINWLLTGNGSMLREVENSGSEGVNGNIKDSFNNIKDFNAKIYNKSTVGKEEIPDIKELLLEKDKQLAEKDKQIGILLEQIDKLVEQQSKLIGKL